MEQPGLEVAFIPGAIGVFDTAVAVQQAVQQLTVVATAIGQQGVGGRGRLAQVAGRQQENEQQRQGEAHAGSTLPSLMKGGSMPHTGGDRKSTRLNSSHVK